MMDRGHFERIKRGQIWGSDVPYIVEAFKQLNALEDAYNKRCRENTKLTERNKILQNKLKIYHDSLLQIAVGDTWVEYSHDIAGRALDEAELIKGE